MVVGAVAIAGASAAVGWFGVKWLFAPEDTAASGDPTTAPAGPTVPLTFDLAQVVADGQELFTPPACGEEWTAQVTPGNQITPIVEVENSASGASARVAFTSESDGISAFLAQSGGIIVTRDDVVVTPNWGTEFVPQLFITAGTSPSTPGPDLDMTGASLCDIADELNSILSEFNWEDATQEEIDAQYAIAAEFEAEHQDLPAGNYKVYAWSPIIMGEPAASARVLAEEGITDLALLQYTAGYSPLASDERIAPYCDENDTPDGGTELLCDVPQDVLMEVLERDVPESYIVDAEPTIAISEAYEFTVE
ncbi:hypothetical protein ON058_00270 [Demequina sp. B12]|uniref:hypothetical protein n=1 Tax=Demequina sp. B12 TaxID=2992757 RepID=UPI00237A4850|nr:hypothetical protein [Demequina sp. B12]MDE0571849.1 hypothetical protein [Demequina sp. B12]